MSVFSRLVERAEAVLGNLAARATEELRRESAVLTVLVGVIIAAYGFELFNLNLTIDDEAALLRESPDPVLFAIDRWVVYVLSAAFFPYPALPTIVLGVSLLLQAIGALLLCTVLGIRRSVDRALIAALILTYPAWAYLYSYIPMTPGVGAGFLFCALGMLIYAQANQPSLRLAGALPAALGLGVHIALLPALVVMHTLLVAARVQNARFNPGLLLGAAAHTGLAVGIYLALNQLAILLSGRARWSYTEGYFVADPLSLATNLQATLARLGEIFARLYLGSDNAYGVSVHFLPWLLVFGVGAAGLAKVGERRWGEALLVLMLILFAAGITPVAFLLLNRGGLRLVLGVSVAIAGIYWLGALKGRRLVQWLLAALAALTVFQFVQANNRWFASAHLSLEADRALAVRLIARIEEAAATSGTPIEALRYLEVAGLPPLAESTAIFRAADAANDSLLRRGPRNVRTAALLNTLGFPLLQAPPRERMLSIAQHVLAMPSWPARDSVRILEDVVVVKFTDYGAGQKAVLCSLARQQARTDLEPVFCVE